MTSVRRGLRFVVVEPLIQFADQIAAAYPELEKEDIYQAAKYAAWLASEKTSAIR